MDWDSWRGSIALLVVTVGSMALIVAGSLFVGRGRSAALLALAALTLLGLATLRPLRVGTAAAGGAGLKPRAQPTKPFQG